MVNEQETDYTKSQVRYSLECKRLGAAAGQWVFTENYSERGMLRFCQADHSYGKGSTSACMIGYVQNMKEDDLFQEVNQHAQARTIPSLSKAATAWLAKTVTQPTQSALSRDFDAAPIQLRHLWIDLRHVKFTVPPPKPTPQKVPKKAKSGKKTAKK